MSAVVVIPSRNDANLGVCLTAIRANERISQPWVAVIDDGLRDRKRFEEYHTMVLDGQKPFIFARNANIGIRWAVEIMNRDVLLLNDDAILMTSGGFSLLEAAVIAHPQYGLVSAAVNNVGNLNQHPQGLGLRDEPRMVCFAAVYIPRMTVERIGYLDERFDCYGFDDDDYCARVRQAGLRIGIFDGCVVDHAKLPSTFRSAGGPGGDLKRGAEIFREKWGAGNKEV